MRLYLSVTADFTPPAMEVTYNVIEDRRDELFEESIGVNVNSVLWRPFSYKIVERVIHCDGRTL